MTTPEDPLALSQEILVAARARDGRIPTLAARLSQVDPGAISGDAARLAFWINVYNALVKHAVAAFGLTGNLLAHRGFFKRAIWHVGGRACSLHVIEHGILRCNRPAPYTFWRPLGAGDPRAAWAPGTFDPRIHFALNCGAVSCPPIRAYAAAAIDSQLDLATRSYLEGEVAVVGTAIQLPYLCKLYHGDFPDLRAFVARHVPPETGAWMAAHPAAPIRWGAYRWEIDPG